MVQKILQLTLVKLAKTGKKAILSVFDFLCLSLTYLVSIELTYGEISESGILTGGVLFVTLSLLGLQIAGIYNAVISFVGIRLLQLIILVQIIVILSVAIFAWFYDVDLSLSAFLLQFLLSVFILAGSRLFARELIYLSRQPGKNLLIYGAGTAGIQLLTSIRQDPLYHVVGFVDDAPSMQNQRVHGLLVSHSSKLYGIVKKNNVVMVALAMPNASRSRLMDILGVLEPLPVAVKKVPKISGLLDGSSALQMLEEIRVEELLGRERVFPNPDLMYQNISNRVILVTGAGGSIGSELCRQILVGHPAKIVLVDHSEFALFKIEKELSEEFKSLLVPILGCVTDLALMKKIMVRESVQTVYHAAAYKHVPLVEGNPFAAIHNNVFGTQRLLDASFYAGVSSFTLVSTDKAVRPTNVMGASKRIAEIICQLAALRGKKALKISMVRFGNVVGSSGSAIPTFREQINGGGPVTITHPEITRYFMAIPEAVELVMQASSLAEGGEVFLLDMGEPIKMVDLAKKLIRFSGNKSGFGVSGGLGEIEIVYTGLRPGEKLYEELLISDDAVDTQHLKIKKIREMHPDKNEFDNFLGQLEVAYQQYDYPKLISLLSMEYIAFIPNVIVDERASIHPNNTDAVTESNVTLKLDLDSHSVDNEVKKYNQKRLARHYGFDLGKKFLLSLAHKYFLLSRPLTMGARCILLNDNREVLLVRHTYISGWHLPGGGVDVGESAYDAAMREVSEETNYRLEGPPKLVGIYHLDGITKRDHLTVFISTCFKEHGIKFNSLEIEESRFFPLDQLGVDVDEETKKWISDGIKLVHVS